MDSYCDSIGIWGTFATPRACFFGRRILISYKPYSEIPLRQEILHYLMAPAARFRAAVGQIIILINECKRRNFAHAS